MNLVPFLLPSSLSFNALAWGQAVRGPGLLASLGSSTAARCTSQIVYLFLALEHLSPPPPIPKSVPFLPFMFHPGHCFFLG